MSKLTSLAWKEWHEARVFLWIGLGVLLGLPLVGAVEQAVAGSNHRFEVTAAPWAIALGGVLAVFAGVGVTTPDRRPKLEDFWRSRPIRVGRWLAVKYAVALAVVLVACTAPVLADLATDRHGDLDAGGVLMAMPFFWTAIFSLAFLSGCLIGRPSHAATLGLAAMLLVYLLPVVVPPLWWMNVATLDEAVGRGRWVLWGRTLGFAGGMLGVSAVAVAVAVVGVKRGWRIESGRRTLYGLVATALLLLFASAAYQLATNLPVLQQVELPADEVVAGIRLDGTTGYVISQRSSGAAITHWTNSLDLGYRLRTIDVGATVSLGPPVALSLDPVRTLLWNATVRRGEVLYLLDITAAPPSADAAEELEDVRLLTADARLGGPLGSLTLWRQKRTAPSIGLYVWGDKLYVFGNRLDVLDVGQPAHPQLVSDDPFRDDARWVRPAFGDERESVRLLALPGVPPAERLEATLRYRFGRWDTFDGRTLVTRLAGGGEAGYRLDRLSDDTATFVKFGEYRRTLLQRLAGGRGYGLTLSHGLLYVDGFNSGGTFNSAVSINRPRRAGADANGRPLRGAGRVVRRPTAGRPGGRRRRPYAVVGGWAAGAITRNQS